VRHRECNTFLGYICYMSDKTQMVRVSRELAQLVSGVGRMQGKTQREVLDEALCYYINAFPQFCGKVNCLTRRPPDIDDRESSPSQESEP